MKTSLRHFNSNSCIQSFLSNKRIIIKVAFASIVLGESLLNERNQIMVLFAFLLVLLIFVLIKFDSSKKKLDSYKRKKLEIILESLKLIINITIITIIVFELEKYSKKALIEGVKICLWEIHFIFLMEKSFSKIFSFWIVSIVFILYQLIQVTFQNTIETIILFLMVFICTLFLINSNSKKKKYMSKLTSSGCNYSSPTDRSKIFKNESYFLETFFFDSEDAIIIFDSNKKLTECSKKIKNHFNINELNKNTLFETLNEIDLFLINQYCENVTPKTIFEEINRNICEHETQTNYGRKKLILNLTDIFNDFFLLKNEDKKIFIVKAKFFEMQEEIVLVYKINDLLVIKIKKDLYLREYLKSQIKLENYSKTISFVAHEFRTPLNCIVNMLQSIEQTVDVSSVRNCVYPALTSSKFLLNLVNDLLDIALLEAGTFHLILAEFELLPLLEDSLQMISMQAFSRGIELVISHDFHIKKIRSDPNRIRQIVTNLLSNIPLIVIKLL